jgi:hypothetical protein
VSFTTSRRPPTTSLTTFRPPILAIAHATRTPEHHRRPEPHGRSAPAAGEFSVPDLFISYHLESRMTNLATSPPLCCCRPVIRFPSRMANGASNAAHAYAAGPTKPREIARLTISSPTDSTISRRRRVCLHMLLKARTPSLKAWIRLTPKVSFLIFRLSRPSFSGLGRENSLGHQAPQSGTERIIIARSKARTAAAPEMTGSCAIRWALPPRG